MNSFIRYQSEIFVLWYIKKKTAFKIFWLEKALWQIMRKKINYLDIKIQTLKPSDFDGKFWFILP